MKIKADRIAFKPSKGDKLCNDCKTYKRCLELEKSGGVPHDGSKACKYFEKKDLIKADMVEVEDD